MTACSCVRKDSNMRFRRAHNVFSPGHGRRRARRCSSMMVIGFLATQAHVVSSFQLLYTKTNQCRRQKHFDPRAASLYVAPSFTTSYVPTKHRAMNYSHFNQDESTSPPLTVTPDEFAKKIASFSSNISRLRVKKKLMGSDEDNTTTKDQSNDKTVNDALVSACNSLVYFLNDEAAKLTSVTAPTVDADRTTLDTITTMRESLETAFIQSIRASSEVGDFVLLPKIVHAAVDYAWAFVKYGSQAAGLPIAELALLQPRIFGEAISSLSKTQASISKIKGLWNYFMNDVVNGIKQQEGEMPMSYVLLSPPSAYELNAMLTALGNRGKIRAATKLYKQFAVENEEEMRIDADAYTASVLFGMLEDSITLNVGGTDRRDGDSSAKKQSPCWQWNEAVELLDTFSSQQMNNVAYASLLKVNEKATEAYFKHDTKHGAVPSAMMVLDRMKKDEICPDVVTCSVIMSAFDKGHHWKSAVSLLDTMQLSSRSIPTSSKWALPSPNIYTYALAISTCARCDKSDVVLSLFDQISTSEIVRPHTWVYNAALSACLDSCHSSTSKSSRGKHLATSLAILEKMEENTSTNTNSAPNIDSYNSVLAMLGQRIFLEAKKTKVKGEQQIRRLTEHSHNSEIVHDILDSMTRQGINRDAVTYSNAIAACFSQPREIMILFHKSINELKVYEGESILKVANSALTAAASFGDMKLVSDVLSILSQARVQMDMKSIKSIIFALGKSGDCEGILALLICLRGQDFANDMLKDRYDIDILGNISNDLIPVLDERVYAAAITSCLKNDDLVIADKILLSMKVKDISLTQTTLHDIIMEYCRMAMDASKEEYRAARIAKRSRPVDSMCPDLLEPIYFTSHARTKAALTLLKSVNKPSCTLLSTIAKACAASGLWQEARALLRRMHRAAIREMKDKASLIDFQGDFIAKLPHLHRHLLKFCAKGGHITPALNYADDIQYFAQQIRLHRKAFLNKEGNGKKISLISISSTLLSETQEEALKIDSPKITDSLVLGRPIGLTGQEWKLLLIAAWRGGYWKICVGTLPFIQPYVKETHPKHSRELSKEDSSTGLRKPSLKTLDRKYSKIESAITAAVLCFEVRSQYAWANRAIEDWIEWSGRRPPRQAVISACRALAKHYKGTEVLNLVTKVLDVDVNVSEYLSEYTYEKSIYIEAITALHQSGLYNDADYLFTEGVQSGHLPAAIVQDSSTMELTLDLHGMSAPVAHSAVRVSIQQEMSRAEAARSKDVIIITGRGRRSKEKFKPVLRPEVQRMLTEEFFPPLGCSTIPGNLGALVVKNEDITTWLDHQHQQRGERLLMIAGALRGISSGARLEKAILSSGNRLERALKKRMQNND